MEKFIVKNSKGLKLANVYYNSKTKKWSSSIEKKIDLKTCPVYLYCMANKQKYRLDNEKTLKFIGERLIPPTRHNIGAFLKKNRIKEYNEYDLLKLSKGKCCLDNCYIEYVGE